MKDNFLLKQLAQAVVDSSFKTDECEWFYCAHCEEILYRHPANLHLNHHKPHCIVLVAEQILKGNEE